MRHDRDPWMRVTAAQAEALQGVVDLRAEQLTRITDWVHTAQLDDDDALLQSPAMGMVWRVDEYVRPDGGTVRVLTAACMTWVGLSCERWQWHGGRWVPFWQAPVWKGRTEGTGDLAVAYEVLLRATRADPGSKAWPALGAMHRRMDDPNATSVDVLEAALDELFKARAPELGHAFTQIDELRHSLLARGVPSSSQGP